MAPLGMRKKYARAPRPSRRSREARRAGVRVRPPAAMGSILLSSSIWILPLPLPPTQEGGGGGSARLRLAADEPVELRARRAQDRGHVGPALGLLDRRCEHAG